jgi:hypothetical protein
MTGATVALARKQLCERNRTNNQLEKLPHPAETIGPVWQRFA